METIDLEGPVSIKDILARLDGRFPMDEAVVEGEDFVLQVKQIPATYADFHLQPCHMELPLCQ